VGHNKGLKKKAASRERGGLKVCPDAANYFTSEAAGGKKNLGARKGKDSMAEITSLMKRERRQGKNNGGVKTRRNNSPHSSGALHRWKIVS